RSFIGKKITEIAKAQEVTVEEAIINLLLISEGRISIFLDTLNEKNVKTGLCHELSFVASDSAGYNIEYYQKKSDLVHPRCFGTFPRFLGRYVEQEHLLNWEEAIRKITFGPAQKMGLKDRGLIKEGYWADLVIINPNEVIDKGTFENPYQFPKGIKYVFVNGEIAVEDENITGKKAGQILKKS
ncbi:MAG: amidohydrolase family protein, partial [Candidatus Portnoybacteria bacterium]|nr:amidohydrolase family protein [Candidatus Portnoybacteria bacterium]